MFKLLILIFLSIIFISCDENNDNSCKFDTDCKKYLEICDINTGLCQINPCYDINCSGNGSCKIINNKASCECEYGYQDNNENLTCEKACNNIDVNNCGMNGACDDSSGHIVCACEKGYFEDSSYQCVSPCKENSCNRNENCKPISLSEFECLCKDDYFRDENNDCINPCETVDCNNHGECVVDSYGKAICNCNAEEGYFRDDNDPASCISPCFGKETCGGHGTCTVISKVTAICNCDEGFQDYDNNLTCDFGCDFPDICKENSLLCGDITGKVDCNCKNNFTQDENHQCVSLCEVIDCNNHGVCIIDSFNNPICTCNIDEGYYRDDNNRANCISPCENHETCGGNGLCYVIDKDTATCTCNIGYQDNDNNLICDFSCDFPDICKENSLLCNDGEGVVDCNCENDYFQDENYQCLNPCSINSCGENENCKSISLTEFTCSCNEGYFEDESHECVNPCDLINYCGDNGSCTSINLTEFTCSCDEGYFEDESHQCVNPCDLVNNCGDYGSCSTNLIGEVECSCDMFYSENDEHQCRNGCSLVNFCGENGTCTPHEDLGFTCNCDEGYFENSEHQCVNTCEDINCSNHGVCDDSSGVVQCNCEDGYQVSQDGLECFYNKNYLSTIDLNNDYSNIVNILMDSNNNIYMVGYLSRLIDFNFYDDNDENTTTDVDEMSAGFPTAFIMKINSDNTYAWSMKVIENEDTSIKESFIDVNDNIYIITGYRNITKLSVDGTILWQKSFVNPDYSKTTIKVDLNDNIYIYGKFNQLTDFNIFDDNNENTNTDVDMHNTNGGYDIFITKLDNNGDYLWTRTFGSFGDENNFDLEIDSLGNTYVLGDYSNDIDLNFNDNQEFIADSITSSDVFLTKISSSGEYIESKVFNLLIEWSDTRKRFYLDVDSSDNIYIKGAVDKYCEGDICNDFNPDIGVYSPHTSNTTLFLTKINSDFLYEWTYLGAEIATIESSAGNIFVDSNGISYLKYNTNINNSFTRIIETISSSGNLLEINTYENFNLQNIYLKDNYLYLYGKFNGAVDFDPTNATDEKRTEAESSFLSKYKLGN